MPYRQAALVAVRRAHPSDRDGKTERTRAVTRHPLFGDLRDGVRRRRRRHRVAERIVLAKRVPRVGMRLVEGHGRHHERGLRTTAVFQDEPGALGIDGERAVVVVGAEIGREVQQVCEVARQVAELPVRDVERARRHSDGLDLLARREITEARDPPDVVVGSERPSEPERDPARGSGDQDLLVAQHRRCVPFPMRRACERTKRGARVLGHGG